MKNLTVKFFSYMMVVALPLFIFTSCEKDPCKDVTCENSGTPTEDGDACKCVCASGYSGNKCENEKRASYTGTYLLSGTDSDGDTYTNLNTVVANSAQGVLKMNVTLGGSITFTISLSSDNSANSFTVDQSVSGGFTYTGTGSFNGNVMSLTLNEEPTGGGSTLVYTLSGAKQ
jgi:hypothetical protein